MQLMASTKHKFTFRTRFHLKQDSREQHIVTSKEELINGHSFSMLISNKIEPMLLATLDISTSFAKKINLRFI